MFQSSNQIQQNLFLKISGFFLNISSYCFHWQNRWKCWFYETKSNKKKAKIKENPTRQFLFMSGIFNKSEAWISFYINVRLICIVQNFIQCFFTFKNSIQQNRIQMGQSSCSMKYWYELDQVHTLYSGLNTKRALPKDHEHAINWHGATTLHSM